MAQESEDGQEKTEDPTSRKQSKAREQGQVPRSRELGAFVVLLIAAFSFLFFGKILFDYVAQTFEQFFHVDRSILKDPGAIQKQVTATLFDFMRNVGLFIGSFFLAALATPMLMGGWNFAPAALAPKFNKLNPISGIKRMFSITSLIEVIKSIGKFLLISTAAVGMVVWQAPTLLHLSDFTVNGAMAASIEMLSWTFLVLVLAFALIVAIDVPFQIWNHTQQLKMTKQEVKDEHKDVEGKPEVKRQIRQRQMEAAMQRMMSDVEKADVVITNPTHFAVALRYDQTKDSAPIVLAKGKNLIALRIRELAQENDVQVLEAPPLARSIFYTTEIGQEIPAGLYMAVAQVLAYVHQVRHFRQGRGQQRPVKPKNLSVPEALQFD